MKILVVSNAYPPYITGGYEIACYDIVQRLRKKGHEIHILTSDYRRKENHSMDSDKKVYRKLMLEDRFYQFRPTPFFDDYRLRQKLAHIQSAVVMQYYLWKIQPDIIFFWNGGLLSYVLISMTERNKSTAYYLSDSWLADPPTYAVFNRQPPSAYFNKRKILGSLTKDCLRTLRAFVMKNKSMRMDIPIPRNVIFCSQALRNIYLKCAFPYEQGEIIYHGIDPEVFYPSNKPAEQKKQFELLYCGRLTQFKGIETLLDALNILVNKKEIRNLQLTVVGKSENPTYPEALKDKMQKLSIEKYVEWIPGIEREKMRELYVSHDILIFPSIWPEPFSITILEAMACGIPIIGTVTGGSKEILVDGENSIVFKEDNPIHLAEKIEFLINNPGLQHKLREQGLVTVKEYSLDRMTDKIEKYLIEIIETDKKKRSECH